MPTLYLLCGLPFSGKSTLARRLRAECALEVVSLDAINGERGSFGEYGLPVEEWEMTNLVARQRVKVLMQQRVDVVIDDTNCYRWLRNRWRDLARENGYDSLVVYLPADPVALRSLIASSADRRRIDAAVFEESVRSFEPPASEVTLTLETTDDISSFIESRRNR